MKVTRKRPLSPAEDSKRAPEKARGKKLQKVVLKEEVHIGPPRLTRFERARIIGARSLQLALGAPPFIKVTTDLKDAISIATKELESKALPISIRRHLPNGVYQDIPIDALS